jgi:hypothetical protein
VNLLVQAARNLLEMSIAFVLVAISGLELKVCISLTQFSQRLHGDTTMTGAGGGGGGGLTLHVPRLSQLSMPPMQRQTAVTWSLLQVLDESQSLSSTQALAGMPAQQQQQHHAKLAAATISPQLW